MGENLDIEGRLSVRSPMQWTDEKNAGFSTAPPSRLRRPIGEGRFGPLAVNAAAQRRDPDSLLSWMERLIRRRRETPELAWGTWEVLETDQDGVLAHRCDWEGRAVVAVHNLGSEPCVVRIDLGDIAEGATIDDLLDERAALEELRDSTIELKLPTFGYRWFRISRPGQMTPP